MLNGYWCHWSLYTVGLELEVRSVARVRPDPLFLRHRVIANDVQTVLRFDVLHVAPAIWAPVLEPEAARSDVRRVILDVMMFNDLTVAPHESFDRGMRVTVRALVKRFFDRGIGDLFSRFYGVG